MNSLDEEVRKNGAPAHLRLQTRKWDFYTKFLFLDFSLNSVAPTLIFRETLLYIVLLSKTITKRRKFYFSEELKLTPKIRYLFFWAKISLNFFVEFTNSITFSRNNRKINKIGKTPYIQTCGQFYKRQGTFLKNTQKNPRK